MDLFILLNAHLHFTMCPIKMYEATCVYSLKAVS